MTKNPSTLTILTPENIEQVEDVDTWWRDKGDLIIKFFEADERRFPLGEIIDQ